MLRPRYVFFQDAVEMIRLHSFTTYTAHALNKSVYDFQSSTRYSDPRTAKVMILLTDGRWVGYLIAKTSI